MPKVIPAQPKRDWRVWVRLSAWALVMLVLVLGARRVNAFLVTDSRFELACDGRAAACASLEIRGVAHASRSRIQQVFVQDFGGSVFRIPLAERRRHLLAVDWVATASISRVLPNRIVVTVTERQPVAFAKLPVAGSARYRFTLIDSEGVLLSIPARVRFHLPVVSGVSEEQREADRRVRVRAASLLLEDLGPGAKQVSEVNAATPEDMRVVADVDGRAVELWMGDQHFRSRYDNFLAHYAEIRKHSEDAGVFDLRLDDRILAK